MWHVTQFLRLLSVQFKRFEEILQTWTVCQVLVETGCWFQCIQWEGIKALGFRCVGLEPQPLQRKPGWTCNLFVWKWNCKTARLAFESQQLWRLCAWLFLAVRDAAAFVLEQQPVGRAHTANCSCEFGCLNLAPQPSFRQPTQLSFFAATFSSHVAWQFTRRRSSPNQTSICLCGQSIIYPPWTQLYCSEKIIIIRHGREAKLRKSSPPHQSVLKEAQWGIAKLPTHLWSMSEFCVIQGYISFQSFLMRCSRKNEYRHLRCDMEVWWSACSLYIYFDAYGNTWLYLYLVVFFSGAGMTTQARFMPPLWWATCLGMVRCWMRRGSRQKKFSRFFTSHLVFGEPTCLYWVPGWQVRICASCRIDQKGMYVSLHARALLELYFSLEDKSNYVIRDFPLLHLLCPFRR